MGSLDKAAHFRKNLMRWNRENPRQLPWKETRDPYLIWLSEIILQQTRVEQGTPYYLRFVETYPTVQDLAQAPLDEVLKNWEGLGYYSRARNLHTTAKYITEALGGTFPNTYKGLLTLKGVGPYTAAAISAFAYQLPHAVLDGNVYRVLARVYGIEAPINESSSKKIFQSLADELLDREHPDEYNQAIMNFGAIQCLPKQPPCGKCPQRGICVAFDSQRQGQLPYKSKKLQKKKRYFYYLVLQKDAQTLIQQRNNKDIWRGLYEFPMYESSSWLRSNDIIQTLEKYFEVPLTGLDLALFGPYKQALTHQNITAVFVEIAMGDEALPAILGTQAKRFEDIKALAFPKLIRQFFDGRQQLPTFENEAT